MVDDAGQRPQGRRRRRAVGPAGAVAPSEPLVHLDVERPAEPPTDDDERLRRDLPPHHDRGV